MHFEKFYCVNLFLSSMAMTSVCQKSICIYQDCRNKGFMFTIKEVWDQVCGPENQFFNNSSCKWPSTSSLKSFTWFWRGIGELLTSAHACAEVKALHRFVQFLDFRFVQFLDFRDFCSFQTVKIKNHPVKPDH